MKSIRNTINSLAFSVIVLTSCSLFGTNISKEEALDQLAAMKTTVEIDWGGDSFNDIPDDYSYMYVEGSSYFFENGKKAELKATYFFSMKEGDMYSVSTNQTNLDGKKSSYEEYVVEIEPDHLVYWNVEDGVENEVVKDRGSATEFKLSYTIMLSGALPDFAYEEIQKETSKPISFKKYNESSLDCCWEREYTRGGKEVRKVSYKDNLASTVKYEIYDKDDNLVQESTMKYTFGVKKVRKPKIPGPIK